MRLLQSPPSPFSAKVRMAARHCGIAFDLEVVDTLPEPDALTGANPLGKIPALLLGDGTALYDSAVICDWLDRRSGGKLLPKDEAGWTAAKRLEATADGTIDAAILTLYEVRFRPEDKRHPDWVDRQWRKATRGLAVLEAATDPASTAPLTTGDFALAALLGWFDLRFPGRWEADHPRLTAWIEAFPHRFPAYEELKPKL